MVKMQLAVELYITTGEQQYWDFIVNNWDAVVASASNCAWYMARIEKQMEGNKKYKKQCAAFRDALLKYRDQLDRQSAATPYGVPYRPSIWGAGWDIQSFGYRHYFLAKEYPDIFAPDQVFDALNFILGRHPGLNQASFAGGVGALQAGLEEGDAGLVDLDGDVFGEEFAVDVAAGDLHFLL